MNVYLKDYDYGIYEEIETDSTSGEIIPFTSDFLDPEVGDYAGKQVKSVECRLTGGSILYLLTGENPSDEFGIPLFENETLSIKGYGNISKFKGFFSGDAKLRVHYGY